MIDLPGVAMVWDALPEARIVGGAVRDGLLGRAVADVDFAVPLAPDMVSARLLAAGLKVVPTGLDHGTVTAVAAGRGFEITTLRRDVATDGRHAIVVFTDDWGLDARRRDFTINAMSASRDGEIFDYFGGRDDLRAGVVRFVGVARDRIVEDYLRIFRFFRFYARYGRTMADAEAVAAITALREGVRGLSAERVWREVKLILAAHDPRAALALMARTGVLELVVGVGDLARLDKVVARGPVDPMLRVAAMLRPGDIPGFAQRWRLSRNEAELLADLVQPGILTPQEDDAALRQALAVTKPEILVGRSWLDDDGDVAWADLRRRVLAMSAPEFPMKGRDVLALGVVPGDRVGEVLRAVHAFWLEGGCAADAASCVAKARAFISRF
ncbi:MAG: CCA tRNA nucleotidyltransferase [Acidocella sp.]|nr:CCA tRNA nucleotidyltransferase [Acidocella sp.]